MKEIKENKKSERSEDCVRRLVRADDSTGLSDEPNSIKLGVIPFEYTEGEKEEVKEYIRSLGPQYQNTTIVLDSRDVPDQLADQIFFVDRYKDAVQEHSRDLLNSARQHKAENPNPSNHTNPK